MENKGARILVVDDEIQIRRLLKVTLTAHGYEVGEAQSGQEGLSQVVLFKPDLVILDLSLPDLEGIAVVEKLREWSQIPIVILSARDQERDKIANLDAGADDYVTKPFQVGELLARIRTALRHVAGAKKEPVLSFGNLKIDLAHRLITKNGQEIKLTHTEYDLLKILAIHGGKVLTHRQLLREVWGPDYERETHYLRVYIGQLRKKIEKDATRPEHILTEPGVGYRLM